MTILELLYLNSCIFIDIANSSVQKYSVDKNTDYIPWIQLEHPPSFLPSSSHLRFDLSDIAGTFEQSPFKSQSGVNANWLPVAKGQARNTEIRRVANSIKAVFCCFTAYKKGMLLMSA